MADDEYTRFPTATLRVMTHTTPSQNLADRLRHIRLYNGFTQRDLAGMLQVSPTRLSRWETGKAHPTRQQLLTFSDKTGASLEWLLEVANIPQLDMDRGDEAEDASPIPLLEADAPAVEVDPHVPGAKLDAGKNRLGLVLGGFAAALTQVGHIGTFGAGKYTPDGWKHVPGGVDRYTDALYRHLLAEAQGEETDPESGLPHAAHVAWNALARLDLMLKTDEKPSERRSAASIWREYA